MMDIDSDLSAREHQMMQDFDQRILTAPKHVRPPCDCRIFPVYDALFELADCKSTTDVIEFLKESRSLSDGTIAAICNYFLFENHGVAENVIKQSLAKICKVIDETIDLELEDNFSYVLLDYLEEEGYLAHDELLEDVWLTSKGKRLIQDFAVDMDTA